MNKEQLSHIQHIQQASQQGKLVVFVGAGVSRNSGVPTWCELISSIKEELPDCLKNETDDLKVAQIYKDSRGHKEYMEKVRNVLKYNKTEPKQIHESILALKPCHLITTNYDNLLEQQIEKECAQFSVVRQDKDLTQMPYTHALIKMHGDYDCDNIVLTEKDYFDYNENFTLIRSFVLSLFASEVILFVGFSFADLNLRMILNQVKNVLGKNMQRAYLISIEEPDNTLYNHYQKMGINIVHFNEPDLDNIINSSGSTYKKTDLTSAKGILLDKHLFAIKNYRPTMDLVDYLVNRLSTYADELKVLGNGLKYIFPENSYRTWNPHSEGLQLMSPYFESLKKQLQTRQGCRDFLIAHPSLQLKELKKLCFYNGIYEIDRITIIKDFYWKHLNWYFQSSSGSYLENFDFNKFTKRLSKLREGEMSYSINDLEYPFALYRIGQYEEAYRWYEAALSKYWNKKKLILYFICLHNMWALRFAVRNQRLWNGEDFSDEITKKVDNIDLDEVISNLTFDDAIKQLFRDLVSFRTIGSTYVESTKLEEEIYKQRKQSERGGWSVNCNIQSLLGKYYREYNFCENNYIICDNNKYYRSLCHTTIKGILNSYATVEAEQDGEIMRSTKIDELDASMLCIMIHNIENKELKAIFRYYDIETIRIDQSAQEYIKECLSNLHSSKNSPYTDKHKLANSIYNLCYLLVKSVDVQIDCATLYSSIIKYANSPFFMPSDLLRVLLIKYQPTYDMACALISQILYSTRLTNDYINCIGILSDQLERSGLLYSDIRMKEIQDGELSDVLFPICRVINEPMKDILIDYCLTSTKSLFVYVWMLVHFKVKQDIDDRFKELLNSGAKSLDYQGLYNLSKLHSDMRYEHLHSLIEDCANTDPCLKFYLNPKEFTEYEKLDMDCVLKLGESDRLEVFKNEKIREKLKEYIVNTHLTKNDKLILIKYL